MPACHHPALVPWTRTALDCLTISTSPINSSLILGSYLVDGVNWEQNMCSQTAYWSHYSTWQRAQQQGMEQLCPVVIFISTPCFQKKVPVFWSFWLGVCLGKQQLGWKRQDDSLCSGECVLCQQYWKEALWRPDFGNTSPTCVCTRTRWVKNTGCEETGHGEAWQTALKVGPLQDEGMQRVWRPVDLYVSHNHTRIVKVLHVPFMSL